MAGGRTLTVSLVANTKSFGKGMSDAVRNAEGFKGKMSAVGASLSHVAGPAMLAAGAAAAGLAVKMGVDAVQGAIAEQQELAKLQQALDNVGQGFRMPAVDDFISKLQMATGVSDSELRPAFQTLVTATGNVAKSMDLMNLAMDISAGTGKDLSAVTAALGKAANGSFTSIGKLTNGAIGPAVLATKDLDQVTAALSEKFGGAASAAANTWAGRIARVEQAAGELQDAFGAGFLSAFDDAGNGVDGLVDSLVELQPYLRDLGKNVGDSIQTVLNLADAARGLKSSLDGLPFPDWAKGVSGFDGSIFELSNKMRDGIELYGRWRAATSSFIPEGTVKSVGDFGKQLTDAEPGPDYMWGARSALQDLYDKANSAAAKVQHLKDVMSDTGAYIDFQAALDGVRKSLKDNGDKLSVFTDKGRENVGALRDMISSASGAADATGSLAEKSAIGQSALESLSGALENTKMDPATRASLIEPFQALIDQLAQSGVNVSSLQAKLDALQSKTITITTQHVTLGDGSYYGSGDAYHGATGGMVRAATGTHASDSIMAMLSRGEYVLNADTVKRVGVGTLNKLNSGGSLGGTGGVVVNVQSAPGERAEESVPRALRRFAFVAGLNG